MGKKSAKKRNQRGADRAADQPAAPREWPVRTVDLDDAALDAAQGRYAAEIVDISKKFKAQWMSVRHRDRPKRLLSLRNIRVSKPVVDACDFQAVLEFEDRHPELFVGADVVPPHRDDTIDPMDIIPQIDAVNRLACHPQHGPEFRRIQAPLHEEHMAALKRGDMTNRFTIHPDSLERRPVAVATFERARPGHRPRRHRRAP